MVDDEFSFIHQYFARLQHAARPETSSAGVVLGIGDDAAILKLSGNYAITTDTLVENVHFFPNFNPHLLGARALEVNFSDVYAMGARPQYITLSLDISERYLDFDKFWQAFAQGVEECLARHNCLLIGGNVTRSNNRPPLVNVLAPACCAVMALKWVIASTSRAHWAPMASTSRRSITIACATSTPTSVATLKSTPLPTMPV